MALLHAGGPYIWVTWLTKLLSDGYSCEWVAWFRSPTNCPPLAVLPLHLASRNYGNAKRSCILSVIHRLILDRTGGFQYDCSTTDCHPCPPGQGGFGGQRSKGQDNQHPRAAGRRHLGLPTRRPDRVPVHGALPDRAGTHHAHCWGIHGHQPEGANPDLGGGTCS